jgi:hypothetical protein
MNPQRDCTPDYSRCCHIKQNGARCTMPALHSSELCYAHHQRQERMRRKPRAPQWSDHQVPIVLFNYMEDHASILSNLNAAADAFARHDIDYRQLSAITRFFETCLRTLRQMHRVEKAIAAEDMVRDVVATDTGELQALPDPDPAASTSPATDPIVNPIVSPVVSPLPDSSSTPDPASGIPAPSAGVVPAISACADPESPEPACPHPPSRSEQPHVFHLFTGKTNVTPLLPPLNRTPVRNPFVSHTYTF